MKTLSFLRTISAALVLGIAATPSAFAQTTTNTATTPTTPTYSGGFKHHHRHSVLTQAEHSQLKKAKREALAADPALQTQETNLHQQFKTLWAAKKAGTATSDQFVALHQQAKTFRTSLRSAELGFDPTLGPIFAKIDAAKHGHHRAV